MVLQIFKCKPTLRAVKVFDQMSEHSFSTKVELDFGDRGTALLNFGNTFAGKQRVFACRTDSDVWRYDDTARERLEKNGSPYHADGVYQDYSALKLALLCFVGRYSLYSDDEQLWLSESVASLSEDIVKRIKNSRARERPL